MRSPDVAKDSGKGNEKFNEANKVTDVALDIAEDNGNGEIEMTTTSLCELDRINYARSLAERAKGKCFILKVHSGLGDVSGRHYYEPALLSIGPHHHGKARVQVMERHKSDYLDVLLSRKNEKGMDRYVEALTNENGEPQARHCYVGIASQMEVVPFGECMVRDGCFMIELFRRKQKPREYVDSSNDMLFNLRWMKPRLARDMLVIENQLPLFVLRSLCALTEERHDTDTDFVRLVLAYFEFSGRPIPFDRSLTEQLDDIPHLLGLVYNALVPEPPQEPKNERKSYEFIRTAVALAEVGVKFVKADNKAKFYDIDFSNGVLSIPRLVINDHSESFFRNLVAYEQYTKNYELHRVVDYVNVMDCLINSSKDVELLRHCGVIENWIGDDEKVSTMFNKLCSGIYFDKKKFVYAEMFDDVNNFCKNPWNMRVAKLKNDYFGSPWSVIKFIAASLLLLLTALQTVYSVASYYQPNSSGPALP